ncbi:MAG: hypothetical protein IJ660_05855 [Alphaproteobacteria bacterium]|nr:hypothetical protein [Alphaproteobacteria bacterium]
MPKVFVTNDVSQADIKVYNSDNQFDADLLINRVGENDVWYEWQWYFADSDYGLGIKKIYWVDNSSAADLVIYDCTGQSLTPGWQSNKIYNHPLYGKLQN